MIARTVTGELIKFFQQYPVVTITGPRQSGKTTLAKAAFPHLAYRNLEDPDTRLFATEDPVAFFRSIPDGAIIDEFQRVPELSSRIQVLVDERSANGQFVLTGSQNFHTSDRIAQSLAGRTAIVRLLPFSLEELRGGFRTFPPISTPICSAVCIRGYGTRILTQPLHTVPTLRPTWSAT